MRTERKERLEASDKEGLEDTNIVRLEQDIALLQWSFGVCVVCSFGFVRSYLLLMSMVFVLGWDSVLPSEE